MKLDNILNQVSSNVMSQMLNNENILQQMSDNLLLKVKTLGFGLVIGVLAFSSTGIAHASSNAKVLNTTIGMAALAGIASSGNIPDDVARDCAVRGKSGLANTAGAVGGALVGKHIGKGRGRKAAIILGALAGGTAVNAFQDNAIRAECLNQNATYQNRLLQTSNNSTNLRKVSGKEVYDNTPSAQYNRSGDFSIGREITGNSINPQYEEDRASAGVTVRYPTNIVSSVPQETVLYAFEDRSRRTTYVTAKDSPGLSSMLGSMGNTDLNQNQPLKARMDTLNNELIRAYENFSRTSVDYLQASNGVKIDEKNNRTRNLNRSYVAGMVKNVKLAQKDFSEARGVFMQLADIAALEGYSLTRYQQASNFLNDDNINKHIYRDSHSQFTKFKR